MGVKIKDDRTRLEKFNDYMVNDGPKIVMIIIWILISLALFAERFYCNCGNNANFFEYFFAVYTLIQKQEFAVYGFGLPTARAAAQVLKFNSALLLITVLRNVLSW
jgi:hypothetical protein